MKMKLPEGLAAGVLAILTAASCVTDSPESAKDPAVGSPLPSFSVELSDGSPFSTETLGNRTAVIEFFNTGCPDCRESLPVLQELYELFREDPEVEVVAISREEGEEKVAAYWRDNGLTVPSSAQADRTVYSLFAASGIPRIYIARKGIIRAVFTPDDTPTLRELQETVRQTQPDAASEYIIMGG